MAVESESPFSIVRSLVKKFLGEMRVIRTNVEEQAKARAEEIKSGSLAPGKAQYSVSEVDGIIRNFKDSYASDLAIFPIPLDRWGLAVMLVLAFLVIPLTASDYWLSSIMLPFYCFSLAALGLNFLTGYAG